jgi:hypothetical protein
MSTIDRSQAKSIYSCINYLTIEFNCVYGKESQKYIDLFAQIASQAFEAISKCDTAYHNLEHSLLVVLTGQEILIGKQLCGESVSPKQWFDFMVALVCHDIGYLKGICRNDNTLESIFAVGIDDQTIAIPADATGARLTPYHVDRSKLYVQETLSQYDLVDVNSIQMHIDFTRFPVPKENIYKDTISLLGLARAADLIGQLSDPSYLVKLPALFSEFEETGSNKALGYSSSEDLRSGYPRFYWQCVYPYLRHSIRYLEMSRAGKAILDNLYNNRDVVEKELLRFYEPNRNILSKFFKNYIKQ